MSFELMQHFNSNITKSLWTKVHGRGTAFNNFNGFESSKEARANFVTNENTKEPLPKYDKAQRLCGGQFIRGDVVGDKLVCKPGIHGIDGSKKKMPTIQEIVDKNWYLFAVTLNSPASNVGHFPQGKGGPVAIPFIFAKEIEFELNWVERWEADTLPDPLKIYKSIS